MKNSKLESKILDDILEIINDARNLALFNVNVILIQRNWLIGKRISQAIMTNRSNDYGKKLVQNLSLKLSKYGKGFDKSTLYKYIKFYKLYPNIVAHAPQSKQQLFLPWSYYLHLITINNKKERDWYENEARICNWNRGDLIKNIKTDAYHRVASHQSLPTHIKSLTENNLHDYVKSLYIFDFVHFGQKNCKEKQLEQTIIQNINKFIIELGKGYSFISNQHHLRTDENDYYIDLVLYNTILKRHLLIDLKVGKINHKDIGQMLIYLKLFDEKFKHSNDNSSIGMILSSDLNSDIVRYLTLDTKNNIVSSKYLTYLPTKEEIKAELDRQKKLWN